MRRSDKNKDQGDLDVRKCRATRTNPTQRMIEMLYIILSIRCSVLMYAASGSNANQYHAGAAMDAVGFVVSEASGDGNLLAAAYRWSGGRAASGSTYTIF